MQSDSNNIIKTPNAECDSSNVGATSYEFFTLSSSPNEKNCNDDYPVFTEETKFAKFIDTTRSVVIFISLLFLSFGSHLLKSSLAVFQVYFVEDSFLTTGGYGILLATNTLPCTFFPFVAGYLYDNGNYKITTFSLLVIGITGQFVFAVAVESKQYWMACVGQFISGIGLSCINVIQRALISVEFKDRKSFSISCCVAMSCFAKFLGKAITAPTVNMLGSYESAVYFNLVYMGLSLGAGSLFFLLEKDVYTHSSKIHIPMDSMEFDSVANSIEKSPDVSISLQTTAGIETTRMTATQRSTSSTMSITAFRDRLKNAIRPLSAHFWWIASAHATYNTVFHLLTSFLPHLLHVKWSFEIKKAGYLASLTALTVVFCAPVIGLLIDYIGFGILICTLAGIWTVVAYYLLLFTMCSPIYAIVLISISEGLIPTITAALIPSAIPAHAFGIGFGVITVFDNILNFTMDVVYGELYNLTGSYDVGLTVLFVFSIFGALLLILYEIFNILGWIGGGRSRNRYSRLS